MRWRTLPIELLLLTFLGIFLLYPLAYVLPGSASDEEIQVVRADGTVARSFPAAREREANEAAAKEGGQAVRVRRWTAFYFQQAIGFSVHSADGFPWFTLVPHSPTTWAAVRNSLLLAVVSTLATTIVCIPLARWFTRFRFRGQGLLSAMLLVPLVLPPFVGGIGLQRLLGRWGTLNLWLMDLGWLDPSAPIDWLGQGGFIGVVIMQVLHLYPILYLNLAAGWANVDPTLEDAARNLGAGEWHVFRTVTFPLLLPGYFAGASLVFVGAFTDLGTPLVFNYLQVVPVRIFFEVSDPQRTNAVAYALVVITLVITAVLFYSARWLVARRAYTAGGKGAVATAPPWAGTRRTLLIYAAVCSLTLLAVLPSVGVALTATAAEWFMTPLPEAFTTTYLAEVWRNPIAALSIRNSLLYAAASTLLDVFFGATIAWLAARRPTVISNVLEGLAMLPLALPGLVLAFGYLTCFNGWGAWLDPTKNPVPLLIIAYTVRRLPYLTRSALAGLQQISPALEEAAENLGAGRWRVVRTVTLPLIAANLVAGVILTFAFALLEVSDSLMLAREEKYFPITRAILGLLMRPDDGDNIASAMGLVAMGLLLTSLLAASLMLGRKMGELFRAA